MTAGYFAIEASGERVAFEAPLAAQAAIEAADQPSEAPLTSQVLTRSGKECRPKSQSGGLAGSVMVTSRPRPGSEPSRFGELRGHGLHENGPVKV